MEILLEIAMLVLGIAFFALFFMAVQLFDNLLKSE